MLYRESEYFNSEDTFLVKTNLDQAFYSKAVFEKGYWWFGNYKATTVLSERVDNN